VPAIRAPRGAVRRRVVTPAVTALSTAVPGRARLLVEGLRGRPEVAAHLEHQLSCHTAVRSVRASVITGSVLVFFDADTLDVPRLIGEIGRNGTRAGRNGTRRRPIAAELSPNGHHAWHTLAPATVVEHLATSPTAGLCAEEAETRLTRFGANRLPEPQPKSALAILAGHVTSLPVMLLGGAAVLSLASGAVVDALAIVGVVVANAVIGYVTESRVERILRSLQNAGDAHAIVRRDDREIIVPAMSLVPGDVLVLRAGYQVAADARLIKIDGLAVDESTLTGESLPVNKTVSIVAHDRVPVADRVNMVFAGTVVAEGAGLAIVVRTGRDTQLGQIRTLVAETETPPTPLERQLDRMGRQLVAVSLGFCGVTLGLGLARGVPVLEMLRTAISLAVAAVPEGLPAVATTTLALGIHRMARHRTLVRRLAAVESLGAVTVICADKTGTVTENRMAVHTWHVGGRDRRLKPGVHAADEDRAMALAMAIGVLCNEAELQNGLEEGRGSSTETALLRAAADAGIDYRSLRARYPMLALQPRVDDMHWMATVHQDGAGRLVAVKGAPEQIVARSTQWLDGKTTAPMTAEAEREVLGANARLAAEGMRVLGLAFKRLEPDVTLEYDNLTWVGLVGMSDPLREGVREAMATARVAGIRTVLLTGDQAATAVAIARDLGLAHNGRVRVLEAAELAGVDDTQLRVLTREVDVFARVSPAHKHQIVRALQANGEVVAMTGDGVNDAAALRAADIGIAMGQRGTDIARDVADVVLVDDDFRSIVRAIEHGRTTHDNISKSLRFLLSTNFSEILATLGALIAGVARPMSAIQFLWINLLSDVFPAIALALEEPDRDVMQRPPRDPAAPLLSRAALGGITADAGILTAATLAAHGVALGRYGAGPHSTTIAFSTLTIAQLLHAFNCRGERSAAQTGMLRSPLLTGVVGGSLALQAAAMTLPPLRGLLGLAPLAAADWALVAGGVAVPFAIGQLRSATRARATAPLVLAAAPASS